MDKPKKSKQLIIWKGGRFCIIYKHALFISAARQTGPGPLSVSGTPACQDQRVAFFSFPLGKKLIYLLRLALFQDLSLTWLPNIYYFTSQFYLPRSKPWVKIHSSEQWFMLGAGIEIDGMHPTMPLTWKYCLRSRLWLLNVEAVEKGTST